MADPRNVGDLLGTRRDLLRIGGLGLLGASLDGVWPLQVSAKQTDAKVQPRGTARNVLFYEMSGAISHVESFDYKDTAGTPGDLEFKKLASDLYMPQLLLPKVSKLMDKIAVMRSMKSHEEVHFRAQYYLQTGRQMNLAFAREIPAIGSVVAAELEERRRPTDTFPTYMSFNLEKGSAGALSTGFLPARFSVVDINTDAATDTMALEKKSVELLEERWTLLSKLRDVEHKRLTGYGRKMSSYEDFYSAAHSLLTDERWPAAFSITDGDKERYGTHRAGLSSILARNVLTQDAGTHYIHICHPGWDHHVYIWDRSKKANHYNLCAEYDQAFSALLEDLATTPSKTNPENTVLDETLVVCMSEFGRTPGALNNMAGRDHHNPVYPALFAGAGVKGGVRYGASDADGASCEDTGWDHKEQPRNENVLATMYSALGIDWSKQIRNTPSGRPYAYVDPLGANGYIPTDEISEIYG
jgi:uncharacterized protein (DUF1501 family)